MFGRHNCISLRSCCHQPESWETKQWCWRVSLQTLLLDSPRVGVKSWNSCLRSWIQNTQLIGSVPHYLYNQNSCTISICCLCMVPGSLSPCKCPCQQIINIPHLESTLFVDFLTETSPVTVYTPPPPQQLCAPKDFPSNQDWNLFWIFTQTNMGLRGSASSLFFSHSWLDDALKVSTGFPKYQLFKLNKET